MSELDKAYETADMLKALDLPISKDLLENIEQLERENEKVHREDLRFYFYEKCFANYTKRIMIMRQAKIRGEVIIAKPVLILTIINGIEENVFLDNKVMLNLVLEERYNILMKQYLSNSMFSKITDISNPFWHLSTDGFWHLQCKVNVPDGMTPSKKWLKENVEYAWLDEDLWVLLQNREWRLKLKEFIIIHKFSVGKKNHKEQL